MSRIVGMRCFLITLAVLLPVPLLMVGSPRAAASLDGWSDPVLVDPSAGAFTSVSCAAGGFCVAIDSYGNAKVRRGGVWRPRVSILPGQKLDDVSCATRKFCMVTSRARVIRYQNGKWHAPVTLPDAFWLVTISCPTETFCVAADDKSQVYTYDGQSWSGPVDTNYVGGDRLWVDCTSESFCMLADPYDWTVYDGSGWSPPAHFEWGTSIETMSCFKQQTCVAVNYAGLASLWRSGHWSQPQKVVSGYTQSSSCAPHQVLCVVVGFGGNVATYTSAGWSAQTVDDGDWLKSVSCSSVTSCVAVDYHERALTFDGSAWTRSRIDNLQGNPVDVSCGADQFCAAVDAHGSALTRAAGEWGEPSAIFHDRELAGVSCTDATFCMAVGNGVALSYNGSRWDDGTRIDQRTKLTSVSCVSHTFCVAVDRSGYAMTFDGTTWSGRTQFSNYSDNGIDVSCATSTFCVAVNMHGRASVYDGSGWSKPVLVIDPPQYGFDAYVSCPAAGQCVAVAGSQAAVLDGGTWSDPVDIDPGRILSGVSCSSSQSCTAIDASGLVVTFDGTAWAAPLAVDSAGGGLTGVSCRDQGCVAVDWRGSVVTS